MNQEPPIQLRLRRAFFRRHPSVVAAKLIGQGFVRLIDDEWVGGRIVETEAYLAADDPASHSYLGLRPKCRSMFADAGTMYVYSIHAKYCANIVTESPNIGSAVLIRAIEPLWGIERMCQNRFQEDVRKLTRGPGMLCQALAINKTHDGVDLMETEEFAVFRFSGRRSLIGSGARIGIRTAVDLPLRFYLRNNRFVSGTLRYRE
jgi:DNA-3-methyladenine glycosylase